MKTVGMRYEKLQPKAKRKHNKNLAKKKDLSNISKRKA